MSIDLNIPCPFCNIKMIKDEYDSYICDETNCDNTYIEMKETEIVVYSFTFDVENIRKDYYELNGRKDMNYTRIIYRMEYNASLVVVPFIPIDLYNMKDEAEKVFNKLMKLVVFS